MLLNLKICKLYYACIAGNEVNMIVKMNNKEAEFYNYMGRIFGSRAIQNQTGDRIYDDDKKEWYIYLIDEKVVGFVSVNNNVIKNVYAIEAKYLEELLNKLNKENIISPSVVTKLYTEIYKACGFVIDAEYYKNFVIISKKIEDKK